MSVLNLFNGPGNLGEAYMQARQAKDQRDQMAWQRERQERQDAQAEQARADQLAANKRQYEARRLARQGDYSLLDEIDPELGLKYRADARAQSELEAKAKQPNRDVEKAEAVQRFAQERELARAGQPGTTVSIEGEGRPIEVPPDVAAARAEAESLGADVKAPTPMDLRKQLEGSQPFKAAQEVRVARDKVLGAPPTGPGDMSLIYGLIKMEDPGSSVKEGEYDQAKDTAGAYGKFGSYLKWVAGKGALTDQQRKELKAEGARLYAVQRANLEPQLDSYRRFAATEGIDQASAGLDVFAERPAAPQARPEMVVRQHLPGAPATPSVSTQPVTPAPQQQRPAQAPRPERRDPGGKPAPMPAPRIQNVREAYGAMIKQGMKPEQALQALTKSGAITAEQAKQLAGRLAAEQVTGAIQ